MIEPVFWKRNNRYYLYLVKNPSNNVEEKRMINGGEGIQGSKALTKMVFRDKVARLKNLRTGKEFSEGKEFEDWFLPWESNVYQVEFVRGS